MTTQTYNLIAEILPVIEETYKISVCGYRPVEFDGDEDHPPLHSRIRWTKAFEVWLPVPKNLLEDCLDDVQTVCRKLTDLKMIESARCVEEEKDAPSHIAEMMSLQDMVLFHVVCVPFKDLVIC